MAKGTVDRATAAMVPALFSAAAPHDSFPWARKGALGFSLLTLFAPHTAFSSNPTADAGSSGQWGEFTTGLRAYFPAENRAPKKRYFAAILLGASFKSTNDPIGRIRLYTQNIGRCRGALASGQLLLPGSELGMSEEAGLSRAAREAHDLVNAGTLDLGVSRESTAVDVALALGGAALGFSLSPWVGLVVGAVSGASRRWRSQGIG